MRYAEEYMNVVMKAGDLLVIGTGAYSDKSDSAPMRLLRDFSKAEAAAAFLDAWPKIAKERAAKEAWHSEDDIAGPDDFLPWLIANGWVEEVDNSHWWHVGDYGRFEPT